MSASDDVWILGIQMTKFGKHPDHDTVDLAAEAATGALADAGVTMADIGVLAAGNLMDASAGIGQQLQKQIGQTGIPVYNVANACATGATALRTAIMAVKAGEVDYGLAVGVEKLSGAGLLGGGGTKKKDADAWTPAGRYGAVAPIDGRIGTETMPGVFAQIGTEYGHKYGGTSFELFAKISEKNHAHSTLESACGLPEEVHARADHERRHDRLPEHAADVLGQLRRRRGRGRVQRRDAEVAVTRAAPAGGQGVGVDPDHRPVRGGLPGAAERQHADPQGRRAPPTSRPASDPSDLDLVELHDCFATAELVHYDNLMLCEEGGAADFFNSGATWRDGSTPVNVSGGLESKGHPIAATGIANVWEICHHLRGEAGDRQIENAKVGLAHVIGLGSACGVHILERSAA